MVRALSARTPAVSLCFIFFGGEQSSSLGWQEGTVGVTEGRYECITSGERILVNPCSGVLILTEDMPDRTDEVGMSVLLPD